MTPPTDRPAKASSVLALLVGVVAVGSSASAPMLPFLLTVVGFCAVAAGLVRGSRGWLAAGAVGMIVGVTFGAIAGVSNVLVVLGAAATVSTWDLSERAIGLGEQLGRDATTGRNEVTHAGTTALVGVAAIGAALIVTSVGIGPLPLPALVTVLLAGIVLLIALQT